MFLTNSILKRIWKYIVFRMFLVTKFNDYMKLIYTYYPWLPNEVFASEFELTIEFCSVDRSLFLMIQTQHFVSYSLLILLDFNKFLHCIGENWMK